MPHVALRSRLVALIRNLFSRSQVERDLDDEVRGSVTAGGVEYVKDQTRDVRAGETLWLLARDFRFGTRSLLKTPGFTAAAMIALALGIGANTAMLSVVNSVLLRPLPYADADRLVVLLHGQSNPVAPRNFLDWRAQTKSFSDIDAAQAWSPNLIGVDEPEQIHGLRMSAGMFPLLGVNPLLGRVFTAAEDTPGNAHVAVIGYGLWQRRFAGDPHVIGRTMLLDGAQTTIVGVMPRTFQFAPFWATHAEFWAPLALGTDVDREGNSLRLFARLKPGVTLAQARADVGDVTARLEQQFPGTNRGVTVQPLKQKVVGDVQTALLVLLAAVAFVLLIACANVAHMLLARAASRQREFGIRTALGATRGRLVTQMLCESLLLAGAGGIAGLVLAAWGVRALVAASPSTIPRVAAVHIDTRVLFMTLAVTCATAVVFGLLPALRAAELDLAETFKDGDRASSNGAGRARLRSVLVASEIALALVLLVAAGLMIRTFEALQHIDPGFDARNVVTMTVSVTGTREADSARSQAFYTDGLRRIAAIPGVESASWINHLPIAGDLWGFSFRVEGRPEPAAGDAPNATYRVVFPGYFHTMRIPILTGRDVSAGDRNGAPSVVVINDHMAGAAWPGESAIGKRISVEGSWRTVVGVVKNTVRDQWAAPPDNEMYLPYSQEASYRSGADSHFGYLTLVARAACTTSRDCGAAALAPAIVSVLRSIDRSLPVSSIQTMTSVVDGATAESRLYLVLLAAFAVIAVALAAVGIYGVMSYSVAQRTHEIGVRIALGADPFGVLRMIVRQGMTVAVFGAGAGVVGALALTRLMGGLLYGVAPRDPLTFIAVTAVLSGVALVASYVPARRATRIDPLSALRSD